MPGPLFRRIAKLEATVIDHGKRIGSLEREQREAAEDVADLVVLQLRTQLRVKRLTKRLAGNGQ